LKTKLLISILTIGFSIILIKHTSNTRIVEIFNNLKTNSQYSNYNGTYNSTETRIIIWRSTKNIIENNIFFGVGTGDIKDALNKQFINLNFIEGENKNYNCHNQFLQFLATFGILLSIPLILILTKIIYRIIYLKKVFLFIILMFLILNSIFESFIETKNGLELIILYGFWYSNDVKELN
jgi:O-antigen ligase